MVPSIVRLRPGVHVVRRDDGHVQVGVDPPARVIAPATPEVDRLLRELQHGLPGTLVEGPPERHLLDRLGAADLLDRPEPALEGAVALESHGLDLAILGTHLRAAGVSCVEADSSAAVLSVVASLTPLGRETVDVHVAAGRPHLAIGGTGAPGRLRLGPFVEPGATACLRCVDAGESEADPRRLLVLQQLTSRPAPPPAPHDLALVLASAARDVVAWLRGRRPATWSTTVTLEDDAAPVVRRWKRHPACGCAWDEIPY